ncbi:DUF6264 family protein [Curtobacterium sp. 9128]|uniref:DUF6264 family protein n=1 Tax=Curtobacterium sp. 9128 TaxID=1793722 RepID=UPI0011A61EBA|nr:DUF6264 family protein [Curtobacterium sp. 9128]
MSARDWSSVPSRDRGADPDPAVLEARPASATTGAGDADGRVHGRPAPQYGEYAPEGWVNPVLVEQERQERERQSHEAAVAARSAAAVGSDRPGSTRAGTARSGSTGPGSVGPGRPGVDASTPALARFGRTPGDFLLTVLLLAFGLVSVVQSLAVGTVASQFRREIERRSTTLADPGALTTAAIVSAVGGIVVFVLVVWWSIVRLRQRKRTVWVPLLGGVVASVVTMVAFVTVLMQDGQFVAWMMQNAGG